MKLFTFTTLKKRSLNKFSECVKKQQYNQPIISKQQSLIPRSCNFKLFDMCLEFIASNIENVESFQTLPSLVGEQIFNECVKLGKFNSKIYGSELVRERLFLFADSYADLVIESIDLSNQQDLTSLNILLSIISKCSLKKLNLSNTKLKVIFFTHFSNFFIFSYEKSLN